MSSELSARVPVIALTGHLGAGKTSTLNHLLTSPGARVGVVVNDFGELDVDAALVSGQIDEAASISGGCLCCLPDTGGLDDALERLSAPRLRLDAIIVEASGVADPVALARIVRFSGAERVRPGGVIEVVDALHHEETVGDAPERFDAATLAVVTKTDLLPGEEADAVVERIVRGIRSRNPRVQIVVAEHGRVDPALVFDAAADEDPPDQLPLARLVREAGHAEHAGHAHAAAVSVPIEEPVSATALVDLLENPPTGAYRIKGRVPVRSAKGTAGYLVNLVGRSIHIARLAEPPAPGELVAIGLELDRDEADAALRRTAAPGSADAAGLRRLRRYRRLSV